MREIKYSVIIPHKYSFTTLKKLLSTIPSDDCFQIIIVDDNSSEVEIEALRNHAYAQNVEIYFNAQGGGAGKARNIGLEKVRGKWVIFADADDYFTKSMQKLLDRFYMTDSDIVYFGCTSVYMDSGETAYRHTFFVNLVREFVDNPLEENRLRYGFTSPCCKMIRTEMIRTNGFRFDEVLSGNDMFFSLLTAHKAKKIEATNEEIYVITVSPGSLVNTFSKAHFDSRFHATLRCNDFLRAIGQKKYQLSVLYFMSQCYKFGVDYFFHFVASCVKHRTNPFIGFKKVFNYKRVLQDRQNPQYTIKKSS